MVEVTASRYVKMDYYEQRKNRVHYFIKQTGLQRNIFFNFDQILHLFKRYMVIMGTSCILN